MNASREHSGHAMPAKGQQLSQRQRIAAVRRFSRFYTRRLGLLDKGVLDTPYTLTEGRVLYEIANRKNPTAGEIAQELALDPGYLSRILKRFAARGLIERAPATEDARRSVLSLTRQGRAEFAHLDALSSGQVSAFLSALDAPRQDRLVNAMATIETLMDKERQVSPAYRLRPHGPGDMGWIVQSHGALYAKEYGWDSTCEALIAELVAKFIRDFDPAREACWMAELEGETVGSVALVKESDEVVRLRFLIVDPKARGLGIGKRLVEECIHFARQAGYRSIVLWTQSVLAAARHLYCEAGFQLVDAEPNHAFGVDLVSETWSLDL